MVISRITTKPFDELNNDTCTFIGSKIFTIRQLDVLTPEIYVNRSDSPWPLVFPLPMSYCGCLMYANDGRKKKAKALCLKQVFPLNLMKRNGESLTGNCGDMNLI